MSAQLYTKPRPGSLQPLKPAAGHVLRPANGHCSNRRCSVSVAAAKQQQQQPRPVFLNDTATTTFLDWAKSQGGRLLAEGSLRSRQAEKNADLATDSSQITTPHTQGCGCPIAWSLSVKGLLYSCAFSVALKCPPPAALRCATRLSRLVGWKWAQQLQLHRVCARVAKHTHTHTQPHSHTCCVTAFDHQQHHHHQALSLPSCSRLLLRVCAA